MHLLFKGAAARGTTGGSLSPSIYVFLIGVEGGRLGLNRTRDLTDVSYLGRNHKWVSLSSGKLGQPEPQWTPKEARFLQNHIREMNPIHWRLTGILRKHRPRPAGGAAAAVRRQSTNRPTKNIRTGEDEWNEAWETAWLPDDLSGKAERAPWESDVSFSLPAADESGSSTTLPYHQEEIDTETKAFVEEMNDNWDQRKGKTVKKEEMNAKTSSSSSSSLYSLENVKRDYRLKKQKIHAGLWVKEIEKQEEAKLGTFVSGGDDIEKLLDSCSEIFDSAHTDLGNAQIRSTEFKNKPDGWETTSKTPDGNLWDMSQREEDILVQEFERRIAFNKFQIASFIKTHIFSRRRPIDGWKYMIEEIGPNSRKGKGSVSRLPSVSDESVQPFREEKINFVASNPSNRGR
ncbi:hypothetical protein F511_31524 [Dorcoceras hygrometricum]|uniref:Uncharacterized protein n=1 Tax=Dorcoceras hygrometricum TaxID=472368 RepID=A0A2Z7B2Z5_9LAMI|nr:hypothetical protein F511_31524 [Dorcoceras hygrometricum]